MLCPSYSKLSDEYLKKEKTNLVKGVKILSNENLLFYLITAEGNIVKSLVNSVFMPSKK
jgi:ABC-type oligopeptide transport system substrate-binding subunit